MNKQKLYRRRQEQLQKSSVITDKTLIVSLDLGKEKHIVHFSNSERHKLKKFSIAHTKLGLEQLCLEVDKYCQANGFSKTAYVMEPTSHFWLPITLFLDQRGLDYYLVHSLSVHYQRKISEGGNKNDDRDAESIKHLFISGQFMKTKHPKGIWVDLRNSCISYNILQEFCQSENNRMRAFLETIFPEYFTVFKNHTKLTSLAVLLTEASPWKIREFSREKFIQAVRKNFKGERLQKTKVLQLYKSAHSDDLFGDYVYAPSLSDYLKFCAKRYDFYQQQSQEVKQHIKALYYQTPYHEYLDSFPNLRWLTHAQFLGFVGDPKLYTHSRALIKLAGTNPIDKESSKYKGETKISYEGKNYLRKLVSKTGKTLATNNDWYHKRYLKLTTRSNNPLLDIQAFVVCGNSYLRTAYKLCVQKQYYKR